MIAREQKSNEEGAPMKTKNNWSRNTTWIGLLMPLLLAWPVLSDAAHVELTDGRRIEGSAIRARANGDIILTTPRGDLTFARGQYREAWADRPPAMDQARQHMQARRYDQVISTLEGVVSEYRHLGWDMEALSMLGAAQNAKGDHAAALSSYNRLFQNAPHRREDPNVRWNFFEALLGADELDRLEGYLNEVISEGDRGEAARAQIMRGDLKRKRGMAEAGLLDYLRTVVLFKAETAVQPEATFKAGVALEEMRDQRAQEMFRKVVEEYGDSPYAQQARAKL